MIIDELYHRAATTPSDIWEHVPTLRTLSKDIRVVEMGTRTAVSTAALLAGRPTSLVSYDLDRKPEVDRIEAAAAEMGVPYQFVQANVLDVEIEPCDLLFVDTLHTYDQLKAELARHGDKVATIALHDTVTFGVRGELPGTEGLLRACNEFFDDRWEMTWDAQNNNGFRVYTRVR